MSVSASVVVVAAGNSTRMGGTNKQFLCLKRKPILAYTLEVFDSLPEIQEIIVVTRKEDIVAVKALAEKYRIQKIKNILPGGRTRQESVVCGLKAVQEERVLIHDGARPFVTKEEVKRVLDALMDSDAALPVVAVKDTVKRINPKGRVLKTLKREELIAAQTPQGFRTAVIRAAHQKAKQDGIEGTDDASVAEYAGVPVQTVAGSYENIKITTPEDLTLAKAVLKGREE